MVKYYEPKRRGGRDHNKFKVFSRYSPGGTEKIAVTSKYPVPPVPAGTLGIHIQVRSIMP
jgi:hypothetical protein